MARHGSIVCMFNALQRAILAGTRGWKICFLEGRADAV
jgi:hypothetical protein